MSDLPYRYVPQEGPMTPLVVSVPHAGLRVPDVDAPLLACDERTLKLDADLHVDRIYERAPQLGAAFIAARISRYVLDLNRSPSNVDAQVCPEFPNPARENPRALIWRLATDGTHVLGRPLTRAELDERIARVHTPYHAKLAELLEERRQRFGYAILLDGHSMPSVGRATHSDTGARRADIVPGNNHGKSCTPVLTDVVCEHFRDHGFSVEVNLPYSGGWITRNYGQPQNNVHAIQIELNRGIYLHEARCEYDEERAPKVARVADALIEKLVDFEP